MLKQKNSKLAERLQDEIYQKMSAKKKLKITSQLFLLGKKLNQYKPILEEFKK